MVCVPQKDKKKKKATKMTHTLSSGERRLAPRLEAEAAAKAAPSARIAMLWDRPVVYTHQSVSRVRCREREREERERDGQTEQETDRNTEKHQKNTANDRHIDSFVPTTGVGSIRWHRDDFFCSGVDCRPSFSTSWYDKSVFYPAVL